MKALTKLAAVLLAAYLLVFPAAAAEAGQETITARTAAYSSVYFAPANIVKGSLGDQRIVDHFADCIRSRKPSVNAYIEVPSSFPTLSYSSNSSVEAYKKQIGSIIDDIFSQVRRENPDIFWLGLGEYSIQAIDYPSYIDLTVELNYSQSSSKAAKTQEKIDAVIQNIVKDAPSNKYKALKYYHDWIVNNTAYDMVTAKQSGNNMQGRESSFNIDGVFLNGKAVCEGYAKAFKVLCDQSGITCIVVYGKLGDVNHGWNYVKLGDSWYMVDCTSDDPVSTKDILRWDYWLVGSGSVADGKKIRDMYTEDGGKYPTLSKKAYDPKAASTTTETEKEVQKISLKSADTLMEGKSSVKTGKVVATVSASGSGKGFTYKLTGNGRDDHLFTIDSKTGELAVKEGPLKAGEYEISVRVTTESGYKAKATRKLTVSAKS